MAPALKSRSRRAARLLFLRLSTVSALLLCASASLSAQEVTLSTGDRLLLAEYRAIGRSQVPMLFATSPSQTGAVSNALRRLGAEILSRRDVIGYIYALVPLDAIAVAVALKGVEAAQVSALPVRAGSGPLTSDSSGKRVTKGVAPTADLAADNPYTAEWATQALDFKTRHPTFDGRGVVTAFVEPVAPNLDSMKGALDLNGRPLPKIGRYVLLKPPTTPDGPVSESKNQMFVWQSTEIVTPAADGTFRWRDREYRLPSGITSRGTKWRMCRRLANPLMPEYDILWSEKDERVWALPATAKGDFSAARSASLRDGLSWVPAEPPEGGHTAMSARALVFGADRQRGWLAVVPTMALHAGMVGSVMSGAGFLGSKAGGVAPASQIAIFMSASRPGAQSFDGIEQMLEMILDPDVDVAEASHAVGDTKQIGKPSIHSIWADRIIAESGKPFVKSAGNFGTNLLGSSELEMSGSVFAVGGYVPKATWQANFGMQPPGEHVLASYSGWGPTTDGGLKPDFLSLTHTLAEGDGFGWYWDGKPSDYSVSGGTSAAAPHGAGHVALLVSAAKQERVRYDAARLRAAIATTGKFLPNVEARAQGHGLIQVSDAWDALKRANAWTPARFKVSAPIVGAESLPQGPRRFTGRGLFELSGWKPGQNGKREITVTRTGGARDANRYVLRWKGHTEVFRSELKEVALPLGRAVTIPIDIRVGPAGSYSAILDLIDPAVNLVAGSILNTVMVADALVPDGEGLRYEREAPRIGNSLFYVDVPAGLSALTISLQKDGGNAFTFVTDPTGRELPINFYGNETFHFDLAAVAKPSQFMTLPHPIPGVWQIAFRSVEPRSVQDYDAVEDWSKPVPLKVHVQGWTATKHDVVEPLGVGVSREGVATLRAGLEPVMFDVQVEPGTTSLGLEMEHADPNARVGLYVFKVPEGARVETTLVIDDTALIYYDSSLRSQKRYTLDSPPAGRYRVALDPISLPGAAVDVKYRNVVNHPVFGTVTVGNDGTPSVEVRARPADGRRLQAEVGLYKRVSPDAPTLLARKGWFVE